MNHDFDNSPATFHAADTETSYQPPAPATKVIRGIGDIARHYDTFLIDQWGVLHDGHSPYSGAVRCLKRLAWAGKQVIIISNSGKRTSDNEARLLQLGFPRQSYTHLVTSGEIAWQMLATGRGFFRKLAGKPCLLMTSGEPQEFIRGLDARFTEDIEKAGFILLAGIDDSRPQSDYDRMVDAGTARGLPLVCANPDLTRLTRNGLQPGAGAIAQAYAQRGGKVHYIGKPHREIYAYCLRLIGADTGSRVLAVGDSLHHDVAGGASAGIDTLLTLNGVHIDHFIDTLDPAEINHRIRAIAGSYGARPDWAAPALRW